MTAGRCVRCGRAAIAIVVGALLLVGLVACGSPDDRGAPGTRPDGTTTTTAAAATRTLSVYLLRDGFLGVAHRRVPATSAVARAALEQLLSGPTDEERAAGLSSAIPRGTSLRSLNLVGNTITVDLTGEFESGAGAASTLGRLAQVTFTLTQFPNVTGVVFWLDGSAVSVFGSEGVVLDGPQTRSSFDAVLPIILVETPAQGDSVTSPLRVSGLSNTFEANVRLRLSTDDGEVLADTFTTATAGTGTWGTFETTIRFDVADARGGRLEVFEDSPRDGSPINVVSIPLRLEP